MAFENVDVQSLKSALNSCKNNLNYSNVNSIMESISNTSVWQCDSQNTLKTALNTLANTKYKNLETKLDQYLEIAGMMEEYKELQTTNENLNSEYSNLKNNLYYDEEYKTTTTDSDGNTITETHTRKAKNSNVESKMNTNRSKYEENKSSMDILKRNISNLV